MSCTAGRKQLLCQQEPGNRDLTGIDCVWVNPDDHRDIAIFFVVEPGDLDRPVDTTAEEFTATITGVEDSSDIPVTAHDWLVRPDASGQPRLTLQLTAKVEGNFQTYRLMLTDTPLDAGASRLDPFCNEIDFSFKQPCPSPFDCRQLSDCPNETLTDYPVDYLARDFESFRSALIAYAEARYPQWDAKVPADFGGMMSELFAALGDEFSYIQDRFQREGYLSTLTQSRSFDALARLVDYARDPGQAASGLVVLSTDGAALLNVPAGARVWADQEDRPPVPFEIGVTMPQIVAGEPSWPVHPDWNDIPAYLPDPETPCLPIGAREMILANDGLLRTPFPAEVIVSDIEKYWSGRQLLIETRPTEPDAPVQRLLVTLDRSAMGFSDPLTGDGALVRIHWRKEDALPFELDLSSTFVSANLVPVRAGLSVTEVFAAGDPGEQALADLPRTIERAGPVIGGARPAIHRFTLTATVENGLGWQTLIDDAGAVSYAPDAIVTRLDPDAGLAAAGDWRVSADPLEGGPQDEVLAIEAGRFDTIFSTERDGMPFRHKDYVDSAGWTLRFGTGTFGRAPVVGDVYRVTYRTGPGASGNVPADTIRRLKAPANVPPPLHSLPVEIDSVRNPFALTDGRDPEPLDRARRVAPAAYKALTFRAVRDEDYREQVERLKWVEQARAVTRWTGSWATTFVTADPEDAYEIDEIHWEEMDARLSAVRQVGREVIPRQPVYQPLDIRIAICIEPGSAFGHVAAGVIEALAPRDPGFFSDRNFSFGDALRRAALEAAVAAVPGVRAVLEIKIRERGRTGYKPFIESELEIATDHILRVKNDPLRPGQGSIRVYHETIPKPEEAA
jgi:hypothetical protein